MGAATLIQVDRLSHCLASARCSPMFFSPSQCGSETNKLRKSQKRAISETLPHPLDRPPRTTPRHPACTLGYLKVSKAQPSLNA